MPSGGTLWVGLKSVLFLLIRGLDFGVHFLLLGHELCASTTARDFLEGFHEDDLPLLFSGEKAEVRGESSSLGGLELVNRRLLAWSQAGSMERTATLDVDASIYGTAKRTT